MKHSIVGIVIMGLLLWSCGGGLSEDDKDTDNSADSLEVAKQGSAPAKVKPGDKLEIRGDNVNMRTQPEIGDNVIMQLDKGDSAVVIEQGPKDKIGDMVDYWYKVEYDDREMWVYGAITSVKSEGLRKEVDKQSGPAEKVVIGNFVEISETGDGDFFVMEDKQGGQHNFFIHDGYQGEQIFSSRPEDMKGLEIKVTVEEYKRPAEQEEGPKEAERIVKVELQ
ncbi:MAG: SH3 domain-containing protein [Bacteroidales bacterium]